MIYRDHFQNYKRYLVPKAQLIIADIPYNLGNNAYASNPAWYKDGNNSNGESEKIHPTQKPVELLKRLIEIFTDEGDVVIDPVAGSGSTLVAAERLNRKGFGFEIKKEFYIKANQWLLEEKQVKLDFKQFGFDKSRMEKNNGLTLFS